MKAITLTQPWATLVALGAKRVETRSWSTNYRGPLAIHAAKGLAGMNESDLTVLIQHEPFRQALFGDVWLPPGDARRSLPRGAVVATCTLKACVPTNWLHDMKDDPVDGRHDLAGFMRDHGAQHEEAFGDYARGRFAWVLEDVQEIPEPVPAKGALGLWEWQR